MGRFYWKITLAVTSIFLAVTLFSWMFEPHENQNFTVENFSAFSETVNGTGHVFYMEQNISRKLVEADARVLNLNKNDELELSSIIRQFGHEYDGRPRREEWHHTLDYKTRYYIENYDYFKYRDRYYKIRLKELYPINSSVEISGKLFDNKVSSEDPAVIQLSLETNTSGNLSIGHGPTLPLGLLNAQSKEDEFYLWSKMYKTSKPLGIKNGEITGWNQTGLIRDYSMKKPLKVNYTIRSDKANIPGFYRAEDSLNFRNSESEGVLVYGVSFDLVSQ